MPNNLLLLVLYLVPIQTYTMTNGDLQKGSKTCPTMSKNVHILDPYWTYSGVYWTPKCIYNIGHQYFGHVLDIYWPNFWTLFGYKLESNIMSNNMPNLIPFLDIILDIILDSSLYPNNVQKNCHFGA